MTREEADQLLDLVARLAIEAVFVSMKGKNRAVQRFEEIENLVDSLVVSDANVDRK